MTKVHSVERHKETGGITFVVTCCQEHHHSVHIQSAHRYTQEELKRVVEDHKKSVAEQHASHLAAEAFVKSLADEQALDYVADENAKPAPCENCP